MKIDPTIAVVWFFGVSMVVVIVWFCYWVLTSGYF